MEIILRGPDLYKYLCVTHMWCKPMIEVEDLFYIKTKGKVIKQLKWHLLGKLCGLIVENEALTSSLTNFHSCFSSSHHIFHSSAASSKLSHFSHRADTFLSKHRPLLSVHLGLRYLRDCRNFINSSLVDTRFDTKALKKKKMKKNRRAIMSINFSENYKLF